MIADIFRILGALYWVPAYQRGYYAREWYWLFRAAHSDGERAQVAANAVMMVHKLCPLDPRGRTASYFGLMLRRCCLSLS